MSTEALTPLILAGFEAIPSHRDRVLLLSLRGNGDMTVSSTLGRYLKDIDAFCQRESVTVLRFQLADLYFLSSSCFHALATLVLSISTRTPESRYIVEFETNRAQAWQKRSLEAIRRVAPATAIVV